MKALNRFTPRMELLDGRSLLSVTLTNGLLEVIGSTGNDVIRITKSSPTMLHVTDDATGDDRTFDLASVTSILVRSRAGNDYVVIGPAITIPTEVRGWTGHDTIFGGAGNDILLGGTGDDNLYGRGGNDTISGQNGYDYLFGGDGNDTVNGDAGNDYCNGGLGDDTINGGGGGNLCQGGGGQDTITNGTEVGIDLIASFNNAQGFAINSASYGYMSVSGERSFDLPLKSLTPNATATVFISGVAVGTAQLDQSGKGELKYATNADFPVGFPMIQQGTQISIQVNGVIVAQSTFYESMLIEGIQLRPWWLQSIG